MKKKVINFSDIYINPDEINVPKVVPTETTVSGILEIVFAVTGTIAVLVIVVAGLMFVMSQGNPEKTSKARNAIIYAAVGLAISILAFSIVKFVVVSTAV